MIFFKLFSPSFASQRIRVMFRASAQRENVRFRHRSPRNGFWLETLSFASPASRIRNSVTSDSFLNYRECRVLRRTVVAVICTPDIENDRLPIAENGEFSVTRPRRDFAIQLMDIGNRFARKTETRLCWSVFFIISRRPNVGRCLRSACDA